MTIIDDNRPVVLYNCDKKEVIGVFETKVMVSRYLYPLETHNKCHSRVFVALRRKTPMKKTIYPFPVAIRYASIDQSELMNGQPYKVIAGYIKPLEAKMKGFDDTRSSFAKEGYVSSHTSITYY